MCACVDSNGGGKLEADLTKLEFQELVDIALKPSLVVVYNLQHITNNYKINSISLPPLDLTTPDHRMHLCVESPGSSQ